jgi:hypothetical protein
MKPFFATFALGLVVALAIDIAVAPDATAARRSSGPPTPRSVTAVSQFGNGTVTGAVRRTRVGLEVRLPGGNWIACGLRCSETLRIQTVDFWEWQSGITNECGALGCLSLELRY